MSLTFDDGLPSHRLVVVPMLLELRLRATFYVNPVGSEEDPQIEGSWRDRLAEWSPAAEARNEIGNHSLLHPCSLNIDVERDWARRGVNLQEWDLARIEADILEAQRRITTMFPNQAATSFAYPCYESTVGRGAHRTSYTPVVARTFIAARVNGELSGAVANDPLRCDLHLLSSYPVEHQQGELLIGLAEAAAARGRWAIFTFHGVNEGHLSISDTALTEFLEHLLRRADTFWVAPVAEVASAIASAQLKDR
jgi:peptidoglycan/xylan/chitin deacetylase (PgdA/CDA1 family)